MKSLRISARNQLVNTHHYDTRTESSYKDMWCSDQLGAVILQSHVAGGATLTNKRDTLMQKIQRTEPNPSLFQIPSDYTILERDPPGGQLHRPQSMVDDRPE